LLPEGDKQSTSTTTNEKALKAAKNKRWEDLLAYHLQLHGLGKYFVREFNSPPEFGRKWRWDFADPVNKVLLEVQGAIWIPNRGHSGGTGIMRDHDKQNAAQLNGWVVFQFNDRTIKSLSAIELVRDYYARRGIVQKGETPPPF